MEMENKVAFEKEVDTILNGVNILGKTVKVWTNYIVLLHHYLFMASLLMTYNDDDDDAHSFWWFQMSLIAVV